jgi:hypothetical protein
LDDWGLIPSRGKEGNFSLPHHIHTSSWAHLGARSFFLRDEIPRPHTVRKEHKLQGLENKMLKKKLRFRKDEVSGQYRILHNKELCGLFSFPNIVRVVKSRRL